MNLRSPRIAAIFAAAALSLAATAPAGGNWNAVVNVTPAGSHVLGDPRAKARLVEYASYTCSHCATFEREASDSLRMFLVRRGRLSFELRNLVRDPIDMTVAMLANCGPPGKFFANHAMFLRSQDRWINVANGADEAQKKRWTSGTIAARMRAIASDFDFYPMMEARGYSPITVNRCLGDAAMAKRLAAQTEEATKLGVDGTPSFLFNGELLAGTHDWQTLQAQLNARM
jgi:protein-disulfide isomerase